MNLPILMIKKDSSIDAFLNYWRKYYESDKYDDSIYFNNLKPLNKLTADNIYQLFEWKNGGNISKNKKKSVDKIIYDLDEIKNRFENIEDSEQEFEKIYNYCRYNFFISGYIWNIFFLHLLKYDCCPIADKYVYLAFNYISTGMADMPQDNWKTYLEYRTFFNKIASDTNRDTIKERKEIDESLWGFGKFLENYPIIITDTLSLKEGIHI